MKKVFVADLKPGQTVNELFLVRSRETRTSTKSNSSWLQLVLVDRTGSIDAKMWDDFQEAAKLAEPQSIVRVQGRVKLYQNRPDFTLERISAVVESELDRADFVASTSENVDELFSKLRAEVAAMKNPWLQKLLLSFLDDQEMAAKLRRAPAAMTMHHAYVGGLLEHIVSLCGLARAVSQHYRDIDHDLLLAGVLLHDIGKTQELGGDAAITYSDEGRLLGHITIGVGLLQSRVAAIPGFPPRLAILIEHMILSHHGEMEFGSPVLPQFREAVLLHYLDDMDSKMASIRASLKAPVGDGDWTPRNPALRREMLRAEEFMQGKSGADGSQAGNPAAKSAKGR